MSLCDLPGRGNHEGHRDSTGKFKLSELHLTDNLVYNIPASLIGEFDGRNVVVRSRDPAEIVDRLTPPRLPHVQFIQLLATPPDVSVLEPWGAGIPIDIVLTDPVAEFMTLYNYATLRETHPVRVTVPVVPGFGKAVRLAVALGFSVKLNLAQPDPWLISELSDTLEFYLHGTKVQQPIEFFHSMLTSFFQPVPFSMWEVNEEDPTQVRFVTDDGEETISRRFAGSLRATDLDRFVEDFNSQLMAEKRECDACDYYIRCGGYFKWPDRSYSCEGIKKLFHSLRTAAAELQCDLNSFAAVERGVNL